MNLTDEERTLSLLHDACVMTGIDSVSLRFDTPELETVYVERALDGTVVVTDKGMTFVDLSRHGSTYRRWNVAWAREECAKLGVDLMVDENEGDRGKRVMIHRQLGHEESLSAIVEAVGTAIEVVFRRHLHQRLQY